MRSRHESLGHDKLVFGLSPKEVSFGDPPIEVSVQQIVGHGHQVLD